MKMLLSKFNKSGQHVMEYTVVFMLITASIVMVGPHVIRAWNATVKMQDDSVTDSFEDPLLEAATTGIASPCSCTGWIDRGCAGTTTGGLSCSGLNRAIERTCTPGGCSTEEECVPDLTCCVVDQDLGCSNGTTSCIHTSGAVGPSLPGESMYTMRCGAETTNDGNVYCRLDAGCVCAAGVSFNTDYATLCNNDNVGLTRGAAENAAWHYVTSAGCTNTSKCQVRCTGAYTQPNPTGTNCICPATMTFYGSPQHCVCNPKLLDNTGCAATECRGNGCAANQCNVQTLTHPCTTFCNGGGIPNPGGCGDCSSYTL